MTFAFWPGLLLLLAVPAILIWHLRRLWHRRVTVPTTEPWVRLLGASRRRRRLPRSLLMALQMAAAACLGLAAGVPIDSRGNAASVDVAVVVDVSASGTPGAAEDLRRAALEAVETAGLVTIVLAGREPRVSLARGTELQARGALDGLNPGEAGAALAPAVVLARAVAGGGADVVVVSGSEAPDNWPARWVTTAGSQGDNRAVTRAALAHGRLLGTIANLGNSPANVPVIVETDGVLVDRREVALAPHGEVDAVWRVPEGARAVTVRLDSPDADPRDDRAVVSIHEPRLGQVIGSSKAMDRALGALPGWQMERAGRATFSVDGSADLTVFLNEAPADLPPGGVLLAGPARVDTLEGTSGGPTPESAEAPIDRSDLQPVFAVGGHPLTAGLDLTGVQVRASSPMTVPAWADPILMAGDSPIAYAGERPGGRVVALGFDLDDPDSSFVTRPAFPVLVARAADWLAPPPPGAVPAGDWVDLSGGDRLITAPDGSVSTVSRRLRTESAGMYEVRGPGETAPGRLFGAWAGLGAGTDPGNVAWDDARAAAAGAPVVAAASFQSVTEATGAPVSAATGLGARSTPGLPAGSIGPELAALALLLVLAEGLWRGLRPERRPGPVLSGSSRLDEPAGGEP